MSEEQKGAPAPMAEEQAADLAALTAAVGADPGARVSAPPTKIPTKEMLAPVMSLGCDLIALMVPPQISQAEKDALTEAYANLLDHYFPEGVDLGPWFAVGLTTAAVFGPRVIAAKMKKAKAAAPQHAQEQPQAAAA